MTASSPKAVGFLLTAAAGWVDAIGYIQLEGLFVSFMSGNTTQAAVHFVQGKPFAAPLAVVACFFAGGFAVALLAALSGRYRNVACLGAVLALMLVAVGVYVFVSRRLAPMLWLAAAMGAQNAVLIEERGRKIGITYVTGALFAAAQDLAGWLTGKSGPSRFLISLGLFAALAAGALGGALTQSRLGFAALAAPIAVVVGALGLAIVDARAETAEEA